MAVVTTRSWKVPGQRTKRKAWGYIGVEDGKHIVLRWSRRVVVMQQPHKRKGTN